MPSKTLPTLVNKKDSVKILAKISTPFQQSNGSLLPVGDGDVTQLVECNLSMVKVLSSNLSFSIFFCPRRNPEAERSTLAKFESDRSQ